MTPDEMKLDMLVAELDYENRLLRARNERLEKELAAQPAKQEPVAGMVLVPYEPCFEMQEQGSMASNYDLSQSRAKRVYQAMIDMHQVLEEKEPSDKWLQLNAGYKSPPARKQWVGLTNEDCIEILTENPDLTVAGLMFIEAKLREKNQ